METTTVPETDVACLGCGYNVRGLADEATCPECGTSIGESIAMMERLLGDRASRNKLGRAITCLAISLGCTCFTWLVLWFTLTGNANIWPLIAGVVLTGNILWWVGSHGVWSGQTQTRISRVTGIAAGVNLVMVLSIIAFVVLNYFYEAGDDRLGVLVMICSQTGLVCRAIGTWLLVERFKSIATAMFRPKLGKYFSAVRRLAVVGLVGLIVALFGVLDFYYLLVLLLAAFPITAIATIMGLVGLILLRAQLKKNQAASR